MNRRQFFASAAKAATVVTAIAIAIETEPATAQWLNNKPHPEKPVKQQQPTRGSSKPLPMYASHRAIRSASLWALMLWWMEWGAGVRAGMHRGVPRKYVRSIMLEKYGMVAEEHCYG